MGDFNPYFCELTQSTSKYIATLATQPLFWPLFNFLFQLAADGASFDTAGPIAKIFLRVLPFILLPMTINFPAVIFPLPPPWKETNKTVSVLSVKFMPISFTSIFAKRGYHLHFSYCWLILEFCFLQISTVRTLSLLHFFFMSVTFFKRQQHFLNVTYIF